MTYEVINGNNIDVLKTYPDNHFDSIVTDPPYGIDFLGKSWDANTGALETYQQCLRVLKPGGYILAFSAARTYHHLAITLEQAGFEIRDQIMWLYSNGFPKSQDIGKTNNLPEWKGWGTALKPAHEPIAVARKPIKQSIAKNCQEWGTGALNIDDSRVVDSLGELRFPSNVIGEILQADYQKYYYCPKVSRKERHIGHQMPPAMFGGIQGCYDENGERYAVGLDSRTDLNKGNNHPTVKPVALMEYLIKLVTIPGGTVLDPFNGSGSTGMAAVGLGYNYIGIELDPTYVDISLKRIGSWKNNSQFTKLFKEESND